MKSIVKRIKSALNNWAVRVQKTQLENYLSQAKDHKDLEGLMKRWEENKYRYYY